jgi:CubicO group peptidase (beta-lactamase class C family)
MSHPSSPAPAFSRRQALWFAAGGALAAVAPSQPLIARERTVATPAPVTTPATEPNAAPAMPMPSTLAADASPIFRTVTEALLTAMQQLQVPGAAIGLLAGGREEHATFGVASLSSLRPVTPDTLFQIGSLSKTFTSTVIWRLIDEGALDLDAPLRTYLPDLTLMDRDVAERVVVRNLLDHTAGWYGDEGFGTGEDDGALERYVAERLPHLPQIFPLGAFFSYNNAAFTVLGRLIEVSTGTTYNAAMQNLLIGPLGLDDSLLDHDAVLDRPYADGHTAMPINGRPTVAVQTPLWIPRSVDPAGGIWSTTHDVLRYARFHMDRGVAPGDANLVHPETLARMHEPAVDVPGLPLQMGMNWFVQDIDGVRAFFHGGDTLGQHTELVAIPDQDFAMVVLTNGQGGGGIASAMALDAALAEIPELSSLSGRIGLHHALLIDGDPPPIELSSDERAEYVGRYADPGQVYTFELTDDGLEVSAETIQEPGAWQPAIVPPPPPAAAAAVEFLEEDIAMINRQRMPFVRNADGQVGWVSVGLRLLPRDDADA